MSRRPGSCPCLSRCAVALAAVLATGCASRLATPPRSDLGSGPYVELLFDDLVRSSYATQADADRQFPPPTNQRPCCAFGYDLRLGVGSIPIPGVRVSNLLDADAVWGHDYDPELVSGESLANGFATQEVNGQVFTCRGGFIDVAHVRDYADWTTFLTLAIEDLLDSGGVIPLPDEAGQRFVYVTLAPTAMLENHSRRELALALAQWLAFQLSIWHETATWYGWSYWSAFPELASAFSPEDFYSNALGIRIAAAILRDGADLTREQYQRSMDEAIAEVLERLEPLPREVARLAADAVDGYWWDSSQTVTHRDFVRRRNFDSGPLLVPWLVPRGRQSTALQQALRSTCRRGSATVPLAVSDTFAATDIRRLIRLDIRIDPALAAHLPERAAGKAWISQDDFGPLVAAARAENRSLFGDTADRPN